MTTHNKPFGTWKSPISPEMIGDSLRFTDVLWDSEGKTLVWAERRGKQTVLLTRQSNDAMREVTDSRYSPSGGVGYGGGSFTVHDGIVYFFQKDRLYRVNLDGGIPHAITPAFGAGASPTVSPDGRWLVFVHTYEENDVLAIVDCNGHNWPQKLTDDHDFVMQPAWSPGGEHLAYIAWDHPNMPWQEAHLHLLSLRTDGDGIPVVQDRRALIAETGVAVAQPAFSPDGRYLAYISDQSGWYHLYLFDMQTETHQQITDGEYEDGIPQWVQGNHTFAWTGDGSAIYFIRHRDAQYSVWVYDVATRSSVRLHELNDYTHFDFLSVAPDTETIAVIASSTTVPSRIITYDTQAGIEIVRRSSTEAIIGQRLSHGKPIQWSHEDQTIHGLYYAPKNPDYVADGIPPLIVFPHRGPTSQHDADFDMEVQFFTSRGYAVLEVNHRGSTGYGRAYADLLEGMWGIYDVEDCISGAKHLIEQGLADSQKLAIMGSSAGGYTVLQALISAPGFFNAGVVAYGVANHFAMVSDTHKFERYYSDWLIGTLPEDAEKYRERSPVFHASKIQDPLMLFQGTDDTVVTQAQADMIVAALRRNKVPHEYVLYEGEGHGFRKPETRVDYYRRILRFLEETIIYA